jgi:hypothetical protein
MDNLRLATKAFGLNVVGAIDELGRLVSGRQTHVKPFEDRAVTVLEAYQEVIRLTPVGAPRIDPSLARVLRVAVAFFTPVDIVGSPSARPTSWCETLVTYSNPWILSLPHTSRPKRDQDTAMILCEHANDLIDALNDLYLPLWSAKAAKVADGLDEICGRFGADRSKDSYQELPTISRKDVASKLRVEPRKVDRMRMKGQLVWVKTWSGGYRYPSFQFDGDKVCPWIEEVLPHAVLEGWPLALFLAQALPRPHRHDLRVDWPKKIEADLGRVGLWRPHLLQPKTGHLDDINGQTTTTMPGPAFYYRVQDVQYSEPWYFSAYDDRLGSLPADVGRLDLPKASGDGTWYLADTSEGAWREILGRRPVISLDDILNRRLWKLTPNQDIDEIADVTAGARPLSFALRRADTLDVARRLHERGLRGIKYGLNLNPASYGYALFGPAGNTDPSVAGLGTWSHSRTPMVDDPSAWAFLRNRKLEDPRLPVILRRLPDGPGVAISAPPGPGSTGPASP